MAAAAKLTARSLARAALLVTVGGLGLCTALAIVGGGGWPLVLLEQFHLHYLVLALAGAIAGFAARAVVLGDAAAMIVAINLVIVAPIAPAARSPRPDDARVRVLAINVLTSNRDHTAVARLIEATRPDVIVLIEVDGRWLAALATTTAGYPGRIEQPRVDNFGIALYARWPLIDGGAHDVGGVPAVIATFGPEAAGLTVIGVHVLPPISGELAAIQAQQLDAVADLVRSRGGPRVLIGDLNATPWSRRFGRVLDRTGLRDSRSGFGVQATFPADLAVIGIPIDHALVSSEVAVVDRRVGPSVGSDHRPVILDLAVGR